MNFKILLVSFASLLALSFGMDAPRPLSDLSGGEMCAAIRLLWTCAIFGSIPNCPILAHFNSSKYSEVFGHGCSDTIVVEKLVESLEECSNLLLWATTSLSKDTALLHEIVSKSSNEASLVEALEHCLKNNKFERAHVIWNCRPDIMGKVDVEPTILGQFFEYAHLIDLPEKKHILLTGLEQEESLWSDIPSEILTQHIFTRL